jgi:hypothetical protein
VTALDDALKVDPTQAECMIITEVPLEGRGCVGVRFEPLGPADIDEAECWWEVSVMCEHEHGYAMRLCDDCLGILLYRREHTPEMLTCLPCAQLGFTTRVHSREKKLDRADA